MITNKDISIDSEKGKITLNGNKYDLGTQGEIDKAVKDVYSVMGQMGAKNLIPYPYYRQSGYSSNGMTVTYDSDGVLTINKEVGTATAVYSVLFNSQSPFHFKPNTKYILTFELENANNLSLYLSYNGTDIATIKNKSTGTYEVTFTTPQTLEGPENLGIYAGATDTETNATVKIMLRLASDTDNTYEPYAMTNKQLTEQVADVKGTIGDLTQTDITGASVAAQLGVLGDILNFTHFVQIPFSTSVLDSIEAAFENGAIPVDVYGITFGIVRGDAGSQRAVFIAQNQSLGASQTRCGAIYFGSYTAPHYCYKQDSAAWVDTAL